MEGGLSGPLLMVARDEEQNRYRVVVKLRRPLDPTMTMGATSLACELICSTLCRLIGVNVPDYACVTIPSDLPPAITDNRVREALARNVGLNFGSVLMEGMATWSPRHLPSSDALLTALEDLLAFDMAVVNGDRKSIKPNLMWRGDRVYAIDHSMALPVARWTDDQRNAHVIMDDARVKAHCAYRALAQRLRMYEGLYGRWPGVVTEEDLAALRNLIPDGWEETPGQLDIIFSFLRARASKLNAMTMELKRVLR